MDIIELQVHQINHTYVWHRPTEGDKLIKPARLFDSLYIYIYIYIYIHYIYI